MIKHKKAAMKVQIYFWKTNWNSLKVRTIFFKKNFRADLKKIIKQFSFWFENLVSYRSYRILEIRCQMKISDSFAIEWVARSFKKVNKLSCMIIFILLSVDHWLTTLMNFMWTWMSLSNFQRKKNSLKNSIRISWRIKKIWKFL